MLRVALIQTSLPVVPLPYGSKKVGAIYQIEKLIA